MLCHRCKTALFKGQTVCSYCGAKKKPYEKLAAVLLVFLLAVITAIIIFMNTSQDGKVSQGEFVFVTSNIIQI